MTDFKKIICVSTEDYKINPDLTKDLMDYVAGEEIFSGHESYKRNIKFDESNDYFEIIENKDIEFYEAIEKLRKINHIEIELKDIENKEINNENIILIHNLYNIWLDNGCFKFFESMQLNDWGISSDKWIKNAWKWEESYCFY